LPDEHSVTTFREFAKIVVPLLALLMARVAGMTAFAQYRLATNADQRQDRASVLADGVS
jgi:hypothetical protein